MSKKNLFSAKYFFCGLAALLGVTINASAVPADPRPKQYVQPDGTTLTVKKCGDERMHFYLTEDGYLLVKRDGYMRYANVDADGNIVASDINASPAMLRTPAEDDYLRTVDMDKVYDAIADAQLERFSTSRSASSRGNGLFPDAKFPLEGSPRGIVILVEYQDVEFTVENPHDYYYRMLNEPGFSENDATGSAADYFYENLMGVFTPQFDVFGPVKLPRDRKYYGANNPATGDDLRPEEMIIDGCKLLDDAVDFSTYDFDEDGFVDNVYVIYAGEGEAAYGDDNTVWPHAFNLSINYSYLWVDGVKVDRYACSNEIYDGVPDGIGNFVHEFSHVMGLPDLYSTINSTSFTPGSWSVMDIGSYNNDARTPPAYSAFERYALGWIDPYEIGSKEESISLDNIFTNQCCIIRTNDENEYFLLENRQLIGWDAYLPGHGMLVWHIHYDEKVWDGNTVNNKPYHQHVDLIEADNRRSELNREGDAFPGTRDVTSITSTTSPALETWTKEPVDCPITDITETDGLISFVACEGKSGIASVDADKPSVNVVDGCITVIGANARVEIYSIDGKLVRSSIGSSSISVPSGTYIVKCGTYGQKVIVQ